MGATANISLSLTAETSTTRDLGMITKTPLSWLKSLVYASGTGSGQFDKLFADSRTVNASTTDTLDLAAALLDVDGAAFTPAEICFVAIYNAGTQVITVQRPAANGVPWLTAAGDAIPIPPTGLLVLATSSASGLATVTAGTGDLIDIVNGAGVAVTYEIVIGARSA
jgi:hypothetical protein